MLAHYKMKYSKDIINKDIDATIKSLFDDVELGYTYDTIKEINSSELEQLEQKVYNMDATIDDKITIKKYYYRKQFFDKTAEEIQIGWDNRYLFFFKRIKELITEPDNIYNKIKNFNKWNSIFPTDKEISKVKLNNELIDQIFKEYYFKDLHKKSYHTNIIKNIYNNFFNKTIIKSKCDNNNNYSFLIDDEVRELSAFACKNLKIYKKQECIEGLNINLDAGIFLD